LIGIESQNKIQRKNLKNIYKKIGIIEFQKNHYDYIISLHEYLYKKGFRDIRIYLEKDVYDNFLQEKECINNHINMNNIRIYDKKKEINYKKILLQLFRDITHDRIDQIYINTIFYGYDLIFYFFLTIFTKSEVIFTIHNINFFFNYTNKKNNLKEIIKKVLLDNIRKKAKSFIVLNGHLKKYAKKFTKKKIDVVPFKLPINRNYNNDIIFRSILNIPKKNIILVIPGAVTNKRRNISKLISIIRIVLEIRKDLTFIFLGRIIDENLEKELYVFHKEFIKNIIYFKNFIPQKDFDKYMIASDYILSPLFREYKISCRQVEKYGLSKASGTEFDAYKYNKKLIIPNFYKIENPSIIVKYYGNYRELLKIILEI